MGAYDYVTKPFDVKELKIMVQKALESHDRGWKTGRLQGEVGRALSNLIISSANPEKCERFTPRSGKSPKKFNGSDSHGESGTGKDWWPGPFL